MGGRDIARADSSVSRRLKRQAHRLLGSAALVAGLFVFSAAPASATALCPVELPNCQNYSPDDTSNTYIFDNFTNFAHGIQITFDQVLNSFGLVVTPLAISQEAFDERNQIEGSFDCIPYSALGCVEYAVSSPGGGVPHQDPDPINGHVDYTAPISVVIGWLFDPAAATAALMFHAFFDSASEGFPFTEDMTTGYNPEAVCFDDPDEGDPDPCLSGPVVDLLASSIIDPTVEGATDNLSRFIGVRPAAVPEPASVLLFAAGFAGALCQRRRRNRSN